MTCKLLVVGNAKCGKTSVIRRFVEDTFSRVGKEGAAGSLRCFAAIGDDHAEVLA